MRAMLVMTQAANSLPPPPAQPGEADQPTASGAAPPRVLLVDDDDAVRLVVADFLDDLGLPVLVAADAIEAIALLEQNPSVALLLSDIRMAGLSGIDLADQAARLRPQLRIVLMSGYFLPQPVARRFLRKPFRLTELETVVREELGV
jgi:CheY-like chemotaxis protein